MPRMPRVPTQREADKLHAFVRALAAQMERLRAAPNIMIEIDLSDGKYLPGEQLAATTHQIVDGLATIITHITNRLRDEGLASVVANRITIEHADAMLLLADALEQRLAEGQEILGKPGRKN